MNYENLTDVQNRLDAGEPLTLEMIAEVFGPAVYEMFDAEENEA